MHIILYYKPKNIADIDDVVKHKDLKSRKRLEYNDVQLECANEVFSIVHDNQFSI